MPEPTEMQNVKSQIYYLTQTVLQLRGALKNTDVAVSSSSTTNDVPSLPSPVLTTTTSTGNNTLGVSFLYFDLNSKEQTISGFKCQQIHAAINHQMLILSKFKRIKQS